MGEKRRLTTSQIAVMMAVLTLVSKFIGFARELVLANYYGTSFIADAYVMGQNIPSNLLGALLGAVSVAFMPVFSQKEEKEGIESANKFTSQLLNCMLLIIGGMVFLGCLFAKPLVGLFAPGYEGEVAALTIYNTRVCFFILFGLFISSVLEAYMQYKGKFLPVTICGYILSISAIVAIVISARTNPKFAIYGWLFGYTVRAAVEVFIVKKIGFKYRPSIDFKAVYNDVLALALPIFIGSSVGQLNSFIDRMLASNLGEGSVSALNYGGLIKGVFSTFCVTIFITIIYPKLNQAFVQNDFERISDLSERGINLVCVLAVPVTLGAVVYSNQVVQVIYERGAFAEAATDATAIALLYYSLELAFGAVSTIIVRIFYAMHDTKTTVYCSVIAVCTNIVLNLILSKFMGHGGLALATSISSMVNTVLLWIWFKKKYPQISLLRSKKKLLLICLFSVISVAVSYAFYYYIGISIWMPRMVLLGFSVIIAVGVYFALLCIAKFDEINLIKDIFKRG